MANAREQKALLAVLSVTAGLFAYSVYVNFQLMSARIDDRIESQLELAAKHGEITFDYIDGIAALASDAVRGLSDESIGADAEGLQLKLVQIASGLPAIASISVLDGKGRSLVSSVTPLPDSTIEEARSDQEAIQLVQAGGTYISSASGRKYPRGNIWGFALVRPQAPAGAVGAIKIVLSSDFFSQYYARLRIGNDGVIDLVGGGGGSLANNSSEPAEVASAIRAAIQSGGGELTSATRSGTDWRFRIRQLHQMPLYVVAGVKNAGLPLVFLPNLGTLLLGASTAALTMLVVFGIRRTNRADADVNHTSPDHGQLQATRTLVANIGQDIERSLRRIDGALEDMRSKSDSPEHSVLATTIATAVDRASALVRQLTFIGRPTYLTPKLVDLSSRMKDLSESWRPLLGDGVALHLTGRDSKCLVRVDPSDFDTAMFALIANVRDAMPVGGKISISVSAPAQIEPGPTGKGAGFATIEVAAVPHHPTRIDRGKMVVASKFMEVYDFCRKSGGVFAASDDSAGEISASLRLPLVPGSG